MLHLLRRALHVMRVGRVMMRVGRSMMRLRKIVMRMGRMSGVVVARRESERPTRLGMSWAIANRASEVPINVSEVSRVVVVVVNALQMAEALLRGLHVVREGVLLMMRSAVGG